MSEVVAYGRWSLMIDGGTQRTGRTREFSRLSIFAKNFVKSFLVSFRFQKKIW